jgi:hypothetical protein
VVERLGAAAKSRFHLRGQFLSSRYDRFHEDRNGAERHEANFAAAIQNRFRANVIRIADFRQGITQPPLAFDFAKCQTISIAATP